MHSWPGYIGAPLHFQVITLKSIESHVKNMKEYKGKATTSCL